MRGDEHIARAQAEARRLTVMRVDETAVEAIRTEAAELFDQIPEPPAYRRGDDPIRARAAELLGRVVQLQARCLAAIAAAPEEKRLPALATVIEAHLRTLAAIAEGDITGAEALWRQGRDLARSSTPFGQFWKLANAPPPSKVYDRETGESRYDPRPEPVVTLKLVCPNTCRQITTYGLSPRAATHGMTCPTCRQPFTTYLAEARSVEASPRGSLMHYALRVDELGGPERLIEFDDASGADLAVAPRDLVAFLYGAGGTLGAVMNPTTGRAIFLAPPGACFVASAVYGPTAPQTWKLRAFRDRRLLSSRSGRLAVRAYYLAAPPVARALAAHPRLAPPVRAVLDAVIRRLPA